MFRTWSNVYKISYGGDFPESAAWEDRQCLERVEGRKRGGMQMLKNQEELKEGSSVAGRLLRMTDRNGQPLSPHLIKVTLPSQRESHHDKVFRLAK